MDEKGARQARKKDNPHKGHRERKRQQFLRYGADPFSDHELLEVLLFYAYGQRDTNPIATRSSIASAPWRRCCPLRWRSWRRCRRWGGVRRC